MENISADWRSFEKAPELVRENRRLASAALDKAGLEGAGQIYEWAEETLQADREFIIKVVNMRGFALELLPDEIKADKEIVLVAVDSCGQALRYASEELRADEAVVWAAFMQVNQEPAGPDGEAPANVQALKWASQSLRSDRDFMTRAMKVNHVALQFADESLLQDPELRSKALLVPRPGFGDNARERAVGDVLIGKGSEVVLSVRVGAADEEPGPFARIVYQEMRRHEFFRGFRAHNPGQTSRMFCGPDERYHDASHDCRGDCDTVCKYDLACPLKRRSPCSPGPGPASHSCWRYAFRYCLREAKDSGGFMVQVVERPGGPYVFKGSLELSEGQRIEAEIADAMGLKTFQIEMPEHWAPRSEADVTNLVGVLVRKVDRWYVSSPQKSLGC